MSNQTVTLPLGNIVAVFKWDSYYGALTIDLDSLRSALKEELKKAEIDEREIALYKIHLKCQDRFVCTIKSHPDDNWQPYLIVHGPNEGKPRHGW